MWFGVDYNAGGEVDNKALERAKIRLKNEALIPIHRYAAKENGYSLGARQQYVAEGKRLQPILDNVYYSIWWKSSTDAYLDDVKLVQKYIGQEAIKKKDLILRKRAELVKKINDQYFSSDTEASLDAQASLVKHISILLCYRCGLPYMQTYETRNHVFPKIENDLIPGFLETIDPFDGLEEGTFNKLEIHYKVESWNQDLKYFFWMSNQPFHIAKWGEWSKNSDTPYVERFRMLKSTFDEFDAAHSMKQLRSITYRKHPICMVLHSVMSPGMLADIVRQSDLTVREGMLKGLIGLITSQIESGALQLKNDFTLGVSSWFGYRYNWIRYKPLLMHSSFKIHKYNESLKVLCEELILPRMYAETPQAFVEDLFFYSSILLALGSLGTANIVTGACKYTSARLGQISILYAANNFLEALILEPQKQSRENLLRQLDSEIVAYENNTSASAALSTFLLEIMFEVGPGFFPVNTPRQPGNTQLKPELRQIADAKPNLDSTGKDFIDLVESTPDTWTPVPNSKSFFEPPPKSDGLFSHPVPTTTHLSPDGVGDGIETRAVTDFSGGQGRTPHIRGENAGSPSLSQSADINAVTPNTKGLGATPGKRGNPRSVDKPRSVDVPRGPNSAEISAENLEIDDALNPIYPGGEDLVLHDSSVQRRLDLNSTTPPASTMGVRGTGSGTQGVNDASLSKRKHAVERGTQDTMRPASGARTEIDPGTHPEVAPRPQDVDDALDALEPIQGPESRLSNSQLYKIAREKNERAIKSLFKGVRVENGVVSSLDDLPLPYEVLELQSREGITFYKSTAGNLLYKEGGGGIAGAKHVFPELRGKSGGGRAAAGLSNPSRQSVWYQDLRYMWEDRNMARRISPEGVLPEVWEMYDSEMKLWLPENTIDMGHVKPAVEHNQDMLRFIKRAKSGDVLKDGRLMTEDEIKDRVRRATEAFRKDHRNYLPQYSWRNQELGRRLKFRYGVLDESIPIAGTGRMKLGSDGKIKLDSEGKPIGKPNELPDDAVYGAYEKMFNELDMNDYVEGLSNIFDDWPDPAGSSRN